MTQPAASDIRVGAVLQDTYEITSLLGKGGMGAVFLARHRRLPGRQVAVKVLQNGAGLNPELFARFRREAEIASQLGHPNIVEVFDFDTLPDGTPFLLMEYLRGESLEARLDRGPLPLAEAFAILRQIGSALQAAHRAGVVHRDLKPANVFLLPSDTGERVKLLDFGISKILDSQTMQTQEAVLMGTPQYMAPEQALGKNSEIDARTDLFALGCIVYEMLSGAPPFAGEGSSIVQVIFRIVHTQPEPLASRCPDAPAHVIAAVERALSKDPKDRYPDVASFITELTGSPLQSLPSAGAAVLSSSRAARAAADEGGLDATHMPSSTVRSPAPALESRPPPPVPSLPPQPLVSAPEVRPEARQSRVKPAVPLALAAVAVVFGVALSNGWLQAPPTPQSGATVPVAAPPPVAAASPPSELTAPPAPPAPPEAMPSAPVAAPDPSVAPKRKPVREASSEAIPEAVRANLEAAARELAAGNVEEALRLSLSSQRTHVTSASFSVMIRAYCRQGNLSLAKAKWREGKKVLSATDRAAVKKFCKQYDIEF
ncbi:serine/threonine-protein kinase [Archangium sp.]|uniref:serine/threonine-protein kinase n=1 Tax=Archangium sp. TaxID=1872627 RepID=UPI00286B7A20|nr:serine/threonine-protein kinase [Archangium sp.]